MTNEEAKQPKQTPQSNSSEKESERSLESIASELESIKASFSKRKSEVTTLKILFYTGLAVLLFGFIYTNQTLQRAQFQNLASNMGSLQSQVNRTLLLLERKLHKEIQQLEAKVDGTSTPDLHQTIQRMNQTLNLLEPQTRSMGLLIENVQRNSNELSQMIGGPQPQEHIIPIPVP
jgi:hypothetical protein